MMRSTAKTALWRSSALACVMVAALLPATAQEAVAHRHRRPRPGDGRQAVSNEAAVFALCRAQLPDAAAVRRHPYAYRRFRLDAGAFGARLTPADAYRFAKGEEVMASSGQPAKLSRPLDFLVVTDHSDNMGFFPDLLAGKPELLADPLGRKWYDMIQNGQGAAAAVDIITSFGAGKFKGPILYSPDSDAYRSAWQTTIKAAEDANDPGRFTAFIGYEWTSNTGGNNLHRNVIFRDNGDLARQVVPYTMSAARQRQSARPVEVHAGL